MSYHFSTHLTTSWEQAQERVRAALQSAGFGIVSEIDVAQTLRKKLGIEFRPYLILGACQPHYAHQAILAEAHIGTMLPCNVLLQQQEDGRVEVSAIDPMASMQAVANPALADVAQAVQQQLRQVIEALSQQGPGAPLNAR